MLEPRDPASISTLSLLLAEVPDPFNLETICAIPKWPCFCQKGHSGLYPSWES